MFICTPLPTLNESSKISLKQVGLKIFTVISVLSFLPVKTGVKAAPEKALWALVNPGWLVKDMIVGSYYTANMLCNSKDTDIRHNRHSRNINIDGNKIKTVQEYSLAFAVR